MRVIGLGVLYGAVFGGILAALFGLGIALFGAQLGLTLPHRLVGESTLGIIINTTQVGLVAGGMGGALLGGLIQWLVRPKTLTPSLSAEEKEQRGRWIGVVAALLPLVWLPYFALRGILRRGVITGEDALFFLALVIAPLAVAAWAGSLMGGRLARVASAPPRTQRPI